jgi:hypothetical protein
VELAISNVSLAFEVTYSAPSLPVAMSVYDTTSGSPTLVTGPTAMLNVVVNTYVGYFTAENNKSYLIFKAVYTDESFATLDESYGQGSETIVVDDQGGSSSSDSSCVLVGFIQNNPLVGYVEC